VHLVGLTIEIYHDVRSHERQIRNEIGLALQLLKLLTLGRSPGHFSVKKLDFLTNVRSFTSGAEASDFTVPYETIPTYCHIHKNIHTYVRTINGYISVA
jgi:hypothetical protein